MAAKRSHCRLAPVLIAALAGLWSPGSAAQGISQITDAKTSVAGTAPMNDSGAVAWAISSSNQLADNPLHRFQLFSYNTTSGGATRETDLADGVVGVEIGLDIPASVAVSDDGLWVAFVSRSNPLGTNSDGSPELFAVRDDGTNLSQLTNDPAPNAGSVIRIAMDGPGDRLAFVSRSNPLGTNPQGLAQLFVVDRDGTGLAQLTTGGTGEFGGLSISDDGSRIVFSSGGDYSCASCSNADASLEIFTILADGTSLTQVTDDALYDSYAPVISGNGVRIAFVSTADHEPPKNAVAEAEIFVVDWGSTTITQPLNASNTFGSAFSGGPSISDDGEWVYFHSNNMQGFINFDGNVDIWRMRHTGAELEALTNVGGTGSFFPFVSGDTSKVTFISFADFGEASTNPDGGPELYAMNGADGSAIVQLSLGETGFSEGPDITPDGTKIAFASNADLLGLDPNRGGEVYLVDPDGSNLSQVTSFGAATTVNQVSISASGQKLVFVSDGDPFGTNFDRSDEVFSINADGTSLIQISEGPQGKRAGAPAIAADGSRLFYDSNEDSVGGNTDGSREIYTSLPDGTGLARLTDGAVDTVCQSPRTDDSGTWVVFESNDDLDGSNPDGSYEIFLMRNDGSSLASITSDSSADSVSDSPDISGDGTLVVYVSDTDPLGTNADGNFELFLYDRSAATTTQITNATKGYSSDPRLSPDGAWIYFLTSTPIFEDDPDGPLHPARYEIATGTIERVGGLERGNPTGPVPSGDGGRAVLSGIGDFSLANPDLQPEIWLLDLDRDARGIEVSQGSPTVITWELNAGPMRYDVIRGSLASLAPGAGGGSDLGSVTCVENNSLDPSTEGDGDAAVPAPGEGFFYLWRGSEGLARGPGSYGQSTAGGERNPSSGDCSP
jgi:Tol biopolymer transport system component